MMLYSNLEEVVVNGLPYKSIPVLKLTSSKMQGELKSNAEDNDMKIWFGENEISNNDKLFINSLFLEANDNNFEVILKPA